jgi:spore germination protein KC
VKKYKSLSLLLIISLLLGGCWDRRELKDIAITMGVGVDYDPAAKDVRITMQIIKPDQMKGPGGGGGGKGGGGGSQQASFLLESQGRTVFEAIRQANFRSTHKLNWTHNAVIILGKSAVEHGVSPLLDLFIRDPEPRPTQWILVTETEAKAILAATSPLEKASAISIDSLMKNTVNTSKIVAVDLQTFIEKLISKTTSAVAPIIKTSSEEPKEVILDGTAVFKKDKMAGELNPNETRGLLWVTGQVKSGVITFETKEQEPVTLEIIQASGSFRPQLSEGKPLIHLKIKVVCNLGEQETKDDMSDPEKLNFLAKKADAVVRNEIASTIKKAQQLRADVFGFGQAFYIKYPKQWKRMESRWDELFPQVKMDVKVDIAIKQVGETTKSLRSI